jgi:hypothetical protein
LVKVSASRCNLIMSVPPCALSKSARPSDAQGWQSSQ